MKEAGVITNFMEAELLTTVTETHLQENGQMDTQQDWGSLCRNQVHPMKEAGSRICSMGLAQSNGQMGRNIQVNLQMVRRKELVNLYGKMEIFTKGNSNIMRLQDLVSFVGQINDFTLETLKMGNSTDMEYSHGRMEENSRDSTSRTSGMDLVYIFGLMELN